MIPNLTFAALGLFNRGQALRLDAVELRIMMPNSAFVAKVLYIQGLAFVLHVAVDSYTMLLSENAAMDKFVSYICFLYVHL